MKRKPCFTLLGRLRSAGLAGACAAALSGCSQNHQGLQSASAALAASGMPSVSSSTVKTEGVGKTFDEALQNGLLLAVAQVNGERVSKSVDAATLTADFHAQDSSTGNLAASASDGQAADDATVSASYSGSEAESGSFAGNAAIVNASSSVSGAVRRFQVSDRKQVDGLWHVTVVAEIPVYQASAASKRLKIAVLPFHLSGGASDPFEENLRSAVVDALSQSGKVAVLDRDYTQENDQEISQLQSGDFSKDEVAKMGDRLGADDIIVGTVDRAGVARQSVYLASVGQTIYGASHASAQLHFRVIEAATGVILLSGTLDSAKYASGSLDTVAKAEAADLANRVLNSLYPLRVEAISNGVLYLGRGGDSMHVGDTFRLIRQGAPIVDSDTHEVIGYSEQDVGQITVTEVEPRLSKASLTSGALAQISSATGLIARPSSATPAAPSNSTSSAPNQSSGAKVAKASRAARNANADAPKEGVDY